MAVTPWDYAKTSEFSHQTALFMWAAMAERFGIQAANDPLSYTQAGYAAKWDHPMNGKVPQLKWLHAIHNQGHGDKVRGGMARAEGVKAGVFDMFLPVPIITSNGSGLYAGNGYGHLCGLYLEMKVGRNQPSEVQNQFAADMRAAGYATEVAWGWLEARQKILAYLGLTID